MEHLPQPSNPILPQVTVPYYCRDEDIFQADDDFSSFPERHSWNKQKLRNLEFEDKGVDQVWSILQSWLFFGVLRSVISIPFDIADFISTDAPSQRRIITTRSLPELVTKWRASVVPTDLEIAGWTPEQKAERYRTMMQEAQRIGQIFEEANMALVAISFAAAKNPTVPQELLLSIEVLLSSLSNSAVFMYGLDHVVSVGSAAAIDFQRLGMFADWCPFILRRMSAVVNSSALYYAGRAAHFTVPRLHGGCTEYRCQSERVVPSKYHIIHCCEGSDCDFKGPIFDRITSILDNDDYPILLLDEGLDGCISLDVVAAKEAPPYVVISHVWAHGLGNPRENSMLTCQLRRLRRLVQDCLPQQRVALWIDTLLCPVDGKYCDLAIAKMVPTYRDAQMVLVLDEGISQASRTLPAVEILLHVAYSMWMQRLWTLQEGALNRKVILQLSDGQRDYDEILRAVGDHHLIQTCFETVSRELLNACQTLRLNGIPESPGENLDFGMWINMLQYRKTSELRDESLCLATLLGHDLATIVGLTPEKRLAKIYEGQRIFPWNVIFSTHPRMVEDGMKWAPQTYLESSAGYGGTLISAPSHFKACYLPDIGLVVDLPTFHFRREGKVTIPMMFQDPNTAYVYIVASASSEYEVEYNPASLSHWTGEFCLAFEVRSNNSSGRSVLAILMACGELVQPTPEMSTALARLEDPSQSFRRMHYVQPVVVGSEPRFGRVPHTDDVCHIIDSTMPVKRICVA